ncbi:MAG TPA: class I SAM-dependent methyltransferase [Chloroflexi bacterium]|nr:class I SAM-dependent methyltransferase [Chloroflexota bacterium]
MQAYGRVFAKVYNLLWNDFADHVAPLIHDFYAATEPGQAHQPVLDLCCGTGRLSRYFLERDFRLVGLDLSEHMVAHARQNNLEFVVAQQAAFVQGDAANFEVAEKFGLTVSTYDALNHLPDAESLQGCFQSVFAALLEGGYFIFDLNTHVGLEHWNGITVRPGAEIYLINRGMYDENTVRAWTKITGFVRDESGLYERFEETVYNTVFAMADVRAWLRAAGFGEVYYALEKDLSAPIENPEAQKRVYFVAQK